MKWLISSVVAAMATLFTLVAMRLVQWIVTLLLDTHIWITLAAFFATYVMWIIVVRAKLVIR